MEALFLTLLNLSITAGWIVLAVLVLRLIFRKAPRWIFCLLWGIVALRLVCPLSLESSLSLIPSRETVPEDVLYTETPQIDSGVQVIDQVVNPVLSDLPATLSPITDKQTASSLPIVNPLEKQVQPYTTVLAYLWFVGMIAMLTYTAVSYFLLKRRVSTATPLDENIKQSEQVASPFVLGIFRPVIYLPYHIDETALEYVIAHEQAHIRRRDHWWKPAGFLLLSVYWFNPLLWVAYIVLCRDIEAACDEKVIKEMEIDDRRAYSSALLDCSVHRRRIAACPLAFGETGVKSRIISVMNYKKPAFWVVTLSLLAVIITSVCLLTVPKSNHATIEWAQTLSAEEVEYVEYLKVYNLRCRFYTPEAITTVVELMNHASGESIAPLDYYGEGAHPLTLTFVMKDGESHTVQNWGNKYLVIDGNHYESPYEWLYSWYEVLDETFLESEQKPLQWIDYYGSPEKIIPDDTWKIELPDFPEVTFEYNVGQVVAVTPEGNSVLLSGSPIWNVYFWDLTGDGLRDLFATVNHGSSFSDTHVIMIDYAEGNEFTLWACGNYDYILRMKKDRLVCEQWTYSSHELISRGNLALKKRVTGIEYIDIQSTMNKPLISNSPTSLRGFHGLYLYVPISGLTYRYEYSKLDPNTLTAYELLYEFKDNRPHLQSGYKPDQEILQVYSVNGYPDYSVLLVMDDEGYRTAYQHCPSKGVNADDLQAAKDMGCVVMENSDVTFGQQIWQDFLNAVNEGQEASVKIAQYYTLDPERCSEEYYEINREDYPELYVDTLTYDGSVYTLGNASGISFSYLMHYTVDGDLQTKYDTRILYVLTNDNTVTWEQLIKSGLSSQLGAAIPYHTVYSDMIYKE